MPVGVATAATRLSSLPIQHTQANKKHVFYSIYNILNYTFETQHWKKVPYIVVHKIINGMLFIFYYLLNNKTKAKQISNTHTHTKFQ
jgi:hypothetical protein